MFVSPGDLVEAEIPPVQILFEMERSIEIFLGLWILTSGFEGGKGGLRPRLVRNKAQNRIWLETVLEMLMKEVMEVVILCAYVEVEELVVEVELFSSVLESC